MEKDLNFIEFRLFFYVLFLQFCKETSYEKSSINFKKF